MLRNKWTSLFVSNFLSVFNDNFLKNCIIFIAIGWSLPNWLTQSQLIALVSASLIVPYLFLSPIAGHLSIRYSKKKVFSWLKLAEIPVIIVACFSFYYQIVTVAILSVFIMGILSCLYSPSKYSLIRDIGGESGVSFGSGIFEMMAFLGILIGTTSASIVSDNFNSWILYGVLIGIALLGLYSTMRISVEELPEEKDKKSTLNPIQFLKESYRFAKLHSNINHAIFGASIFWLIGGMLQMNLVIHSKHVYQTSNTTTGIIMAIAGIGVALGCWVAGKIQGKEVRIGLILIGIVGMTIMFLALALFPMGLASYTVSIFTVAFMGGIFQVPCLSMLQNSNIGRKLGDMIAYLNIVTFIFVLIGTLLFSITTYFSNENSFAVFGVLLGVCLLVTLYFYKVSSEFWLASKKLLNIK